MDAMQRQVGTNTSITKEEFLTRISKLQELLRVNSMSGFLVTQHIGLYYLTGSMQAGFAFIPAEGDAVFYVRRSVERARAEAAIRVEPLTSFRGFKGQLESEYPHLFAHTASTSTSTPTSTSTSSTATSTQRDDVPRIATEMDVLPAQTYSKLAELFASMGGSILMDGSAWLRRLRMVKSAYEINRIEAAAIVVAEAIEEAAAELREGMTELAFMARIEYGIRVRGHLGLMRTRSYNMEVMTGMLGAGSAAAEPSAFDGPAGGRGLSPAAPQSVSHRAIGRGEPILIDIGCCIDGYVIDQTRVAVIGQLPDKLAEAYEHSVTMIRKAEQQMMPGTSCESLYLAALEQADQFGLAEHFMGYRENRVKFLGHGIGLEVDEWPVLARGFNDPLEPGMVLAVEPKFTFPGEGVVGIENTYLITPSGPRQLTRSPEELIIIP